jgi:hypothetical protein
VNALEALRQIQAGERFSIRGKAPVRKHGRTLGVIHEGCIIGSSSLLSHSLPQLLDVGSGPTRAVLAGMTGSLRSKPNMIHP